MKTRVAIIEDNARFREELAALIASTKDLELAGAVGSAEEALAKLPALAPSVVVMDINLPGASGIECAGKLRELLPEAQILMLTVYEDTDSIFRALQAGATGYLLKRAHPRDILNGIRVTWDTIRHRHLHVIDVVGASIERGLKVRGSNETQGTGVCVDREKA